MLSCHGAFKETDCAFSACLLEEILRARIPGLHVCRLSRMPIKLLVLFTAITATEQYKDQ